MLNKKFVCKNYESSFIFYNEEDCGVAQVNCDRDIFVTAICCDFEKKNEWIQGKYFEITFDRNRSEEEKERSKRIENLHYDVIREYVSELYDEDMYGDKNVYFDDGFCTLVSTVDVDLFNIWKELSKLHCVCDEMFELSDKEDKYEFYDIIDDVNKFIKENEEVLYKKCVDRVNELIESFN